MRRIAVCGTTIVMVLALSSCAEEAPVPTAVEMITVGEAAVVGSDAEAIDAGKEIFHDKNLSRNRNQACATCHDKEWGFTGPGDGKWPSFNSGFTFFAGSFDGRKADGAARFGDRKPPSAAYASFSPSLQWHGPPINAFKGGLFWDGRATGVGVIGPNAGLDLSPIQQQALGPFQSDVEHGFSELCVLYNIYDQAGHRRKFERATGVDLDALKWDKIDAWVAAQISDKGIAASLMPPNEKGVKNGLNKPGKPGTDARMDLWCHSPTQTDARIAEMPPALDKTDRDAFDAAYSAVGYVVGAYESSKEFNRFSSDYDRGKLTPQEVAGEILFKGVAGCAFCHSSPATNIAPTGATPVFVLPTGPNQKFSDFSYYNIGLPKPLSSNHPRGATYAKDRGLGAFLETDAGAKILATSGKKSTDFYGFFRTPTLRNVAIKRPNGTRTYMHNGMFTSLEQVVHFYNTRDVKSCSKAIRDKATSSLSALLLDTPSPSTYDFPIPGNTPEKDLLAGRCWPAPEIPETVTPLLGLELGVVLPAGASLPVIGNIGLTLQQEKDLVAFLKALTDK